MIRIYTSKDSPETKDTKMHSRDLLKQHIFQDGLGCLAKANVVKTD